MMSTTPSIWPELLAALKAWAPVDALYQEMNVLRLSDARYGLWTGSKATFPALAQGAFELALASNWSVTKMKWSLEPLVPGDHVATYNFEPRNAA